MRLGTTRWAVGASVLLASILHLWPAAYADVDPDATDNHRIYQPASEFTEGVCGFPVRFTPLVDKQYVVRSTTEADGTQVDRVTGRLTYVLTNVTSGKSIVVDVGGPATVTSYPDGALALDGEGHTLLTFSHATQLRLGVPGIDLIDGHAHFVFDPTVVPHVSFTAEGRQTDGCALLRD